MHHLALLEMVTLGKHHWSDSVVYSSGGMVLVGLWGFAKFIIAIDGYKEDDGGCYQRDRLPPPKETLGLL